MVSRAGMGKTRFRCVSKRTRRLGGMSKVPCEVEAYTLSMAAEAHCGFVKTSKIISRPRLCGKQSARVVPATWRPCAAHAPNEHVVRRRGGHGDERS